MIQMWVPVVLGASGEEGEGVYLEGEGYLMLNIQYPVEGMVRFVQVAEFPALQVVLGVEGAGLLEEGEGFPAVKTRYLREGAELPVQ